MYYDKNSFLSGLAAGRCLRGRLSGGGPVTVSGTEPASGIALSGGRVRITGFYEWAAKNGAGTVFHSAENYAAFLETMPYQEISQGETFPWYPTFGDLWNGPDGQRLYYYCGNNPDLLSPSEAGAENRSYDVSPWATNTTFYAGIPSQTRWNQIKAPWDGTYVITNSIGIDSYYTYGGNTYPVVRRYNAATYYARQGTTFPFSAPGSYEGFQCYTWRGTVYMPVVEVTPDPGVIQSDERAGYISGCFGIRTEGGEVIPSRSGILVDEARNTVFHPATGQTIAAESWTYDFPSRTYTFSGGGAGSDGVIVTYGEDTVTLTDGSGTCHIYYVFPLQDRNCFLSGVIVGQRLAGWASLRGA